MSAETADVGVCATKGVVGLVARRRARPRTTRSVYQKKGSQIGKRKYVALFVGVNSGLGVRGNGLNV